MLKTIERKKNKTEDVDGELTGMKRLPRGSFRAKPGATAAQNCKVKITTYLDADVLEFFKKRAEQPNAAPYQTQINNELRRIMEQGAVESSSSANDLLNDASFLRALKDKLETV